MSIKGKMISENIGHENIVSTIFYPSKSGLKTFFKIVFEIHLISLQFLSKKLKFKPRL